MRIRTFLYIVLIILCVGCRADRISDDPSLTLAFSTDSLAFDTVFTGQGSSTRRILVYNPNEYAVRINTVALADGRWFKVNIDGEPDQRNWHNMVIRGGDSAIIFVKAVINPQDHSSPVLIEDTLLFSSAAGTSMIRISAYGQDVEIFRNRFILGDTTLAGTRPYLVFDTLFVAGDLTVNKGTTFYMHKGALLQVQGSFTAEGMQDEPITFRGSRTDRLFDSVPYDYASGQWNGIYLLHPEKEALPTYTLSHVDIRSGSTGLYAFSESADPRPVLTLSDSRIHNMAVYGAILQNVDALLVNNEISNCAAYCVYLAGGNHTLIHNTVAAYFGYPYSNINIHTTSRDDVAAVFINNLSKTMASMSTTLLNNIITGAREQSLVVATPLPDYYRGDFRGNYLRCDTIAQPWCHDNVYAQKADSVFRNIHYLYKEYHYFDFRLDSLSPAIGIADSLTAVHYPKDRLGKSRTPVADAGCYQH